MEFLLIFYSFFACLLQEQQKQSTNLAMLYWFPTHKILVNCGVVFISQSRMDSYEATRVVFTRIQNLDPEYASKIIGLLFIKDHGKKEMILLASSPESLFHFVILKARKKLDISSGSNAPSSPSTPSSPSQLSPHSLSLQNSANSSTTSRLVNGGVTNLPSPLSIPSLSSSWTNSNFSDFQHRRSQSNE